MSPWTAVGATFDQLVTVFPEGAIGVDDSQVVLLRLPPELLTERTVDGGRRRRVGRLLQDLHPRRLLGRAVRRRQPPPDTLRQLVCPCHQSVVRPDRRRPGPSGGPATRSLPQLPLDVDADGFLVAQADFDAPVGPIAWDEA